MIEDGVVCVEGEVVVEDEEDCEVNRMRTGLLMATMVGVVRIRIVRIVVMIRVGAGGVQGGVEGVDIVGKC